MLEVKDKAAALKFTRIAQVLFVVAGGAAVAVAFVGGPRSTPSSSASYTPKEVTVGVTNEKASPPLDLTSTSERMGLLANAPRPLPPPDANPSSETIASTNPAEVAPAPPPRSDGDAVQYFGPVRLGNKTLALLSFHGKQRFAALQDMTDDGTVTEITSEHVTLTAHDVDRKIERAAKTSDVVTRVSGVGSPKGQPVRTAGGPRVVTPGVQPMVNPVRAPQPVAPAPMDLNARLEDIRLRLKTTGMYTNDDELTIAAKQEMERQMMNGKPPEKGGK